MGLKQPYLVFQIYVPPGQHISFEVGISDTESTRRRLFFSSSFSDVKATPLHCQVPLPASLIVPGQWVNLSLHMPALAAALFSAQGVEFRAVESIAMGAVCKLRKIFTLKSPPLVTDGPDGRGDIGVGFGGLNGGGLGVVGSHTGTERVAVGGGGGGGGGVGAASNHTLAALPQPIHRTVDFLMGVDRCTQVVDPAKLLECQVALPASTLGFGSPGRENVNVDRLDRPFTEQAIRDGTWEGGGDALAPIRKNGTAGGVGVGHGHGTQKEPLHLAFGTRFPLQGAHGAPPGREGMTSAGSSFAHPQSSRGGMRSGGSHTRYGWATDRADREPNRKGTLPPASRDGHMGMTSDRGGGGSGRADRGSERRQGWDTTTHADRDRSGGGQSIHPSGRELPALELAAEALASHALHHAGNGSHQPGGGVNGSQLGFFPPPGASSPRSVGGDGGNWGWRSAVTTADATLASLGDLATPRHQGAGAKSHRGGSGHANPHGSHGYGNGSHGHGNGNGTHAPQATTGVASSGAPGGQPRVGSAAVVRDGRAPPAGSKSASARVLRPTAGRLAPLDAAGEQSLQDRVDGGMHSPRSGVGGSRRLVEGAHSPPGRGLRPPVGRDGWGAADPDDLAASISVVGVKQSYPSSYPSEGSSGWMRDGFTTGGEYVINGEPRPPAEVSVTLAPPRRRSLDQRGGFDGESNLGKQPPPHAYSSTRYCDDQDDEDAMNVVDLAGSGRMDKLKPLLLSKQPSPPPPGAPALPAHNSRPGAPGGEGGNGSNNGATNSLVRPSLDPLTIPSPGGNYEMPVRSVRSPSRPEGFPSIDADGASSVLGSSMTGRFATVGFGSNVNVVNNGGRGGESIDRSGGFGARGSAGGTDGGKRETHDHANGAGFPRLSVDGDSEAAEELRLATGDVSESASSVGGVFERRFEPSASLVRVSAAPTVDASEVGEDENRDHDDNDDASNPRSGARDSHLRVSNTSHLSGVAGLNSDAMRGQHHHSSYDHRRYDNHVHGGDEEDGVRLGEEEEEEEEEEEDEQNTIRLGAGRREEEEDGVILLGGKGGGGGYDFSAYGDGAHGGNDTPNAELSAENSGIAYFPNGSDGAMPPPSPAHDGTGNRAARESEYGLVYPRESEMLMPQNSETDVQGPPQSSPSRSEAGSSAWGRYHRESTASVLGRASRGGKETPIPGSYPAPSNGTNYRAFTPELVVPSRYQGISRQNSIEPEGPSDPAPRDEGRVEESWVLADGAAFGSAEKLTASTETLRLRREGNGAGEGVEGGIVRASGQYEDGEEGMDGAPDAADVAVENGGGGKQPIPPPPPGTGDLDLIYDPILNFYYDPKNGKYYELM